MSRESGLSATRPYTPAVLRRIAHLLLAAVAVASLLTACTAAAGAGRNEARILMGGPSTLDPAATGDAGSAAVIAQLFESLTAFDDDRVLQPALAESWQIDEDGRRIVFQLRPDLAFSDGTPLQAGDVVRSWVRLIDPEAPSPLVTLMFDVVGAREYVAGQGSLDAVGLTADDDAGTVTVDLVRPAADFPTIVASPSFAVVPPGIDDDPAVTAPGDGFVASGGYRLTALGDAGMTFRANDRYWAGTPALTTIEAVSDLGGASAVEAFEDGTIDYTPIGGADADWIAYDPVLGPQLREVGSLSTDYYGFDATTPPFDDVRVRQAFAAAVDWRRIGTLALDDPEDVATSMVPPGIPGRSERDVVPLHDPERARALLSEAGFPGGAGFPETTILSGGSPYDDAVITELERELGISVHTEIMPFDAYFERLDVDAPAMWFLSWVADYPGRNDFLGVLLGTGSVNNYGGWSSPEFDAAIAEAGAAADPVLAGAAYDEAEAVVQREAPVIPMSYGTGWALSREGLLGAGQNGLGSLRLAGMAWAD